MWPDCSPPDVEAFFAHALDHVTVADRSALEREPQAREMPLKPEVRHHGGDHAGLDNRPSSRQLSAMTAIT